MGWLHLAAMLSQCRRGADEQMKEWGATITMGEKAER